MSASPYDLTSHGGLVGLAERENVLYRVTALIESRRKATRQRDNWKRRALLANDVLGRWIEWARMHGHIEHADGIVKDSRKLLAEIEADTEQRRQEGAGE